MHRPPAPPHPRAGGEIGPSRPRAGGEIEASAGGGPRHRNAGIGADDGAPAAGPPASPAALGFLAALGATSIWGLGPLFFDLLNHVPRDELLAHRGVWACAFALLYCAMTGRLPRVAETLSDRATMRWLALSTAMMTANWFVFLIAVAAGRVFDAGLGYYMLPLMQVALGVAVFGERLSRLQWAAVAVAALAVAVLSVGLGAAPWLPLAIAGSFAVYGFVRKRLEVGSIVGFQVESLLIAPVSLGWLAGVHLLGWRGMEGIAAVFGTDPRTSLLLVASGIVTALPLILFAEAARRLPYATLGLMQYLSPSLQIASAALILGEAFTRWHWWALALIWCALALYGRELVRAARAARRAGGRAEGR